MNAGYYKELVGSAQAEVLAHLNHTRELMLKLYLLCRCPVRLSLAERVLPVHGRHVLHHHQYIMHKKCNEQF